VDRRRFLYAGACALGAGLSRGFLPARAEEPAPAGPLPDLVVARGEEIRAVTHKALRAFGGMGRFVQPGQVVVLKPNASFESPPDWGATTHPEVVAAVLEACFEAGARRALVVDHTMKTAETCFQRSGLAALMAGFPKAKLVSLDQENAYEEIEVPAGKALKKTRVPSLLGKADVLINLPTAKSHSATQLSLGLKNLMGLVWDRHTFHSDMDLHQGIADLATALKPHLTVLDAVRLLKTGGPSGPGQVDPYNGVIVGIDPVAVDAYGTGLAPWSGRTLRPAEVGFIRHAADHGLGTLELDRLRILELKG